MTARVSLLCARNAAETDIRLRAVRPDLPSEHLSDGAYALYGEPVEQADNTDLLADTHVKPRRCLLPHRNRHHPLYQE
jgi:hypothetical protein